MLSHGFWRRKLGVACIHVCLPLVASIWVVIVCLGSVVVWVFVKILIANPERFHWRGFYAYNCISGLAFTQEFIDCQCEFSHNALSIATIVRCEGSSSTILILYHVSLIFEPWWLYLSDTCGDRISFLHAKRALSLLLESPLWYARDFAITPFGSWTVSSSLQYVFHGHCTIRGRMFSVHSVRRLLGFGVFLGPSMYCLWVVFGPCRDGKYFGCQWQRFLVSFVVNSRMWSRFWSNRGGMIDLQCMGVLVGVLSSLCMTVLYGCTVV